MSILLSPRISEAKAEADWLCSIIETNAEDLTAARLGETFRLGDAFFRLHMRDRNTIYRVSGQFDWFLKLPPSGDARVIARERLGATMIGEVLGLKPEYGGSPVIRVSTAPSYVLASTIPGTSLNRVLATEAWVPGSKATARLEESFSVLGMLLATLHAQARLPPNAPEVTKHPFASLKKRLEQVTSHDPVIDAIAAWYKTHGRLDRGDTFVHGNMRLDNVLRVGGRVGFVGFEHCGAGSLYQDLARPIVQLLLLRAVIAFPHYRVIRCLNAYLREYRNIQAYESQQLDVYVGTRLARHYVETRNRRLLSDRVGGIPIVRSRLGRLTTTLLRDGIAGVAQGLSV
jgi:hypothetical protein